MSDGIKAVLYPVLFCLVLFSPVVFLEHRDSKTPITEPQVFMQDYVIKIERVAWNNEYIITSKSGKIVSTKDFKKYKWIQH